jgi:very-short-patch-repair endonuclease
VDFFRLAARLVIEVDGATHDDHAYDARRTAYLERQGLRVIRIWNHAVFEDLAACCDAVLAACGGEAPHPPLSQRERPPRPASAGAIGALPLEETG